MITLLAIAQSILILMTDDVPNIAKIIIVTDSVYIILMELKSYLQDRDQ